MVGEFQTAGTTGSRGLDEFLRRLEQKLDRLVSRVTALEGGSGSAIAQPYTQPPAGSSSLIEVKETDGSPDFFTTGIECDQVDFAVTESDLAKLNLAATAVTAGTYRLLTGTVDAKGRLTAAADGITGYAVECQERTFTETSGAGVWTGSVTVPAGATLIDIKVLGIALWNSATSATMKVGDVADDDGWFTGIDLKATDLLAGEEISFDQTGGKQGVYLDNTTGFRSPAYSASSRVISGIITKVGTAGTAGLTRLLVEYVVPTATAATKV